MPRTKKAARPVAAKRVRLLIATRKGLWTLTSDARAPRVEARAGPQFLGHIVHHAIADPRDGADAARRRAHRAPRADRVPLDRSRQDVEGSGAPAGVHGGQRARRRSHVLADARATRREPGIWYAGTSPQGLFRSEDGGATWDGVDRLQRAPAAQGRGAAATRTARPTGRSCTRSSSIRATRSISTSACRAAACSSRPTRGADWRPLNEGVRADFLPNPIREFGHDPHCVRFAAGNPDRLYQQNHCGIYRIDRPGRALAGHRRRDAQVGRLRRLSDGRASARSRHRCGCSRWTAPTSGRASRPAASPAAYRSRDGGKTWKRQATGIAQGAGVVDGQAPGDDRRRAPIPRASTSARRRGEVWGSRDEGRTLALPRTRICRTSTRSKRDDGDAAAAGRCARSRDAGGCHSGAGRIPTPAASYTGSARSLRRRAGIGAGTAAHARRRARGPRRDATRASASG